MVGVPDNVWQERPLAIVKLLPGATESAEDIIRFLQKNGVEKGKFSSWMIPTLYTITDDIPKISVGKFDKKAIRQLRDDFLKTAIDLKD